MKWDSIQLGEVINIKHGFAFKGEYFVDSGEHILLTPGNCYESGGLRIRGDKEKYYSGEFPEEYLLQEGDMLVVMTDLISTAPILGGSFLIPESNRYLHNQRLGLVQVTDDKRIDKKFLYYLLNTHNYRGQVRGSASGATVRHTSPCRIRGCKVRVPRDVKYQEKIGEMLSAYDESFENNRRQMILIERSARLIYQEWFVRLKFPGHEHVRITKGIPAGWRTLPFNEICPDLREAANPNEVEPDTPYIGLEHIPRRSITLNEWGHADEVTSTKLSFKSGDILFGKIRPYFHKVGFALTDGVASSDAIVLRPVAEVFHGYALLTVSSDWFVAVVSKTAKEGSKMPRADWNLMEKHQILAPPNSILVAFQEIVAPMIEQLRTLAFTNHKLRAARDLLLPRLMSGEIAV